MQVLCGQCGRTLNVDDALAGGQADCPHCGRAIAVPSQHRDLDDPDAQLAPQPTQDEDGFAFHARAAMERKVRVVCGKCSRGLSVSFRMAGRNVRCPACLATIQIPGTEEEDAKALSAVRMVTLDPAEKASMPETAEAQASQTPADSATLVTPVSGDAAQLPPATIDGPVPATTAAVQGPAPARSRPVASAEPAPDAAVEQPPTRELPPADRTSRRRFAAFVAVGILVVAGLVALIIYSLNPAQDDAGARAAVEPQQGQPTPLPTVAITPTPEPTPLPTPTPAPPPPPPPVPAAISQVTAVSAEFFASEGYYPARPAHVYWKVDVAVQVEQTPLEFSTLGENLCIRETAPQGTSDDPSAAQPPRKFACLGLVAAKSLVPRRADPKKLLLDKGEHKLRLLFEVPQEVTAGCLVLPVIGEIDIEVKEPFIPRDGDFAGQYSEVQPRNLRPAPDDPVIAALQAEPALRVRVRQSRESIDVDFPGLGMSSPAKRNGDMLEITLRRDDKSLNARLRLIDRGKGMILYLSDEPFHQATFRRE